MVASFFRSTDSILKKFGNDDEPRWLSFVSRKVTFSKTKSQIKKKILSTLAFLLDSEALTKSFVPFIPNFYVSARKKLGEIWRMADRTQWVILVFLIVLV